MIPPGWCSYCKKEMSVAKIMRYGTASPICDDCRGQLRGQLLGQHHPCDSGEAGDVVYVGNTKIYPLDSSYVPASCGGEKCKCGEPAARKVEETLFDDDPYPVRHPLTAYLCSSCFNKVMHPKEE